ncbi:putative ATP synthase, subunit E [[Clostridium] methylpentosum DSM 5476]|uniref:Putative ATP synthase, subunit E n=1 Tax=[Clostridium] methylpentosum DSM 5476 TaxID=537013 RepID=C0EH33_9FIRM|nr:putative ATP synthase, subunit E [[Clostridium] methylpentosum DSM 5476]
MSYDQDKLQRFQKTVLSEAEGKIAQMEQEIQEYEKTELEKARQAEYDKMFAYMQSKVHDIQWKYRQSVTKASLEAKRRLLQYRTGLADKVFAQVEQKLKAFTASDQYEAFLIDKLKKAEKEFPCQNAVIRLCPDDMKHAGAIQAALSVPVTVEPDRRNHLGGFQIVNEQKGLLLDDTFASNLTDQHATFYKICGMTVA